MSESQFVVTRAGGGAVVERNLNTWSVIFFFLFYGSIGILSQDLALVR
jgi:hypothetical protein